MGTPSRRWTPVTHMAVRVRCPMCDVIGDVPAQKVRIYHCTTKPDADFYAWVCPECGQAVTRRGDVSSVCLLVAAGVATSLYEWPVELDERARVAGPWSKYEADDLSLDIAALPEAAEGAA